MNEKESLKRETYEKQIYDEVIIYIKKYDNFLNKIAHNVVIKCVRLEFEDVKQQLILSLFTNCNTFDDSRNASISTYYSQVAINTANNIVKKYWQLKNKINVEYVSLDAYIKEEESNGEYIRIVSEKGDGYYNPESFYRASELVEIIEEAKTYLSAFENKVFRLLVRGFTIDEIASLLQKTKKTIYNVLAIIREKIKKHF